MSDLVSLADAKALADFESKYQFIHELEKLKKANESALDQLTLVSQKQVYNWPESGEGKILQLVGPIGSGKTYINSSRAAVYLRYSDFTNIFDQDRMFLVTAKTSAQVNNIKAIFIQTLIKLGAIPNSQKEILKLFKKDLWLIPNVNNMLVKVKPIPYMEIGSSSRADNLLSDNYIGMLIEEANTCNDKILQVAFNRMNRSGFKEWRIWMQSNPGSKSDPYQVKYLDNPKFNRLRRYWTLPIEENPNFKDDAQYYDEFLELQFATLPEEYLQLQRLVGIPANPSNLILPNYYDYFADKENSPHYFVGVDYGQTEHITAAVSIGWYPDTRTFHIQDELIIDPLKGGERSFKQQAKMISAKYPDAMFYGIDATAGGLHEALDNETEAPVFSSEMKRKDRRQLLTRLLELGTITVGRVPRYREELSQWHTAEATEVAPEEAKEVRFFDDAIDAGNYGLEYGRALLHKQGVQFVYA